MPLMARCEISPEVQGNSEKHLCRSLATSETPNPFLTSYNAIKSFMYVSRPLLLTEAFERCNLRRTCDILRSETIPTLMQTSSTSQLRFSSWWTTCLMRRVNASYTLFYHPLRLRCPSLLSSHLHLHEENLKA